MNQSSTTGATPPQNNHAQNYNSSLSQYHQQSASPAPIQHPHQFTQQASNDYTQPPHASVAASHISQYSTPTNRYAPPVNPRLAGANVNGQRQTEVWHLPENANQAIPEEIRSQFQQDAQGHVLFWTAPPGDTMRPVKPGSAIGHTARYLADKIRAKQASHEKRRIEGFPEAESSHLRRAAKRVHKNTEDVSPQLIEDLKVRTLRKWTEQMQASTNDIYKSLYGHHWEEGKKYELEKFGEKQADHKRQVEAACTQGGSNWEKAHAAVADDGIYKDDYDPRY